MVRAISQIIKNGKVQVIGLRGSHVESGRGVGDRSEKKTKRNDFVFKKREQ